MCMIRDMGVETQYITVICSVMVERVVLKVKVLLVIVCGVSCVERAEFSVLQHWSECRIVTQDGGERNSRLRPCYFRDVV